MNQIVEEVLPVHVYVQGSNYGARGPLMLTHCHIFFIRNAVSSLSLYCMCVVWSGWFWTRQTNCLKTDQVILVSGIRYVLYCHLSKHVTILYNDEVCNFALHLLSRTGNSGWLVGLYFDPPYLYLIKVRKVWGTLFVIVCIAILISSTGIENDFLVCLSTHLLD